MRYVECLNNGVLLVFTVTRYCIACAKRPTWMLRLSSHFPRRPGISARTLLRWVGTGKDVIEPSGCGAMTCTLGM